MTHLSDKADSPEFVKGVRDMWLMSHDIFRDETGNRLDVKDCIEVLNEAYRLTVGEDIDNYLKSCDCIYGDGACREHGE